MVNQLQILKTGTLTTSLKMNMTIQQCYLIRENRLKMWKMRSIIMQQSPMHEELYLRKQKLNI